MEVHIQQRRMFLKLLLILFPDPDHLAEDLHVEALTLRLGVDVLLIIGEPFDFLLDPLDALDKGAQLITGNSTWGTHDLLRMAAMADSRSGYQGEPIVMVSMCLREGMGHAVTVWDSGIDHLPGRALACDFKLVQCIHRVLRFVERKPSERQAIEESWPVSGDLKNGPAFAISTQIEW
jgi:hypothetical protein